MEPSCRLIHLIFLLSFNIHADNFLLCFIFIYTLLYVLLVRFFLLHIVVSLFVIQKYNVGQINAKEFSDAIWKNFVQGKLTFLHWTKAGEEMAPIITPRGGTLLVRKMAFPVPK